MADGDGARGAGWWGVARRTAMAALTPGTDQRPDRNDEADEDEYGKDQRAAPPEQVMMPAGRGENGRHHDGTLVSHGGISVRPRPRILACLPL